MFVLAFTVPSSRALSWSGPPPAPLETLLPIAVSSLSLSPGSFSHLRLPTFSLVSLDTGHGYGVLVAASVLDLGSALWTARASALSLRGSVGDARLLSVLRGARDQAEIELAGYTARSSLEEGPGVHELLPGALDGAHAALPPVGSVLEDLEVAGATAILIDGPTGIPIGPRPEVAVSEAVWRQVASAAKELKEATTILRPSQARPNLRCAIKTLSCPGPLVVAAFYIADQEKTVIPCMQ
jgi:hypothetical protein